MGKSDHEPRGTGDRLGPSERMLLDLDLRLGTDVWDDLSGLRADLDIASRIARLVYVKGYIEGLTEAHRGQLMLDHGFAVPPRRKGQNGSKER